MKKGVMNTSRRESNFINRMSSEQRDRYIKDFIARCNPEQLIPFIKITKHDKHFREIEYVINVPDKDIE
ncbi:hypothetical protein [Neobacillus niacini]|uniref:hypothetical protein n=1 Tax=Neobacillus niacini TaxID=86668 RepID=UPI0021CB64BD|nr:hypothetical protein [Neobacillus niacini]MCM3763461.1 hypothetical protein [Neobacillus niacini]